MPPAYKRQHIARPSDLSLDLVAVNIVIFALLKPLIYPPRVPPLLNTYTLAALANRYNRIKYKALLGSLRPISCFIYISYIDSISGLN